MKAVVASAPSARLADVAEPAPASKECLVRVKAALVTPFDLRAAKLNDEHVLGQSFIGVVEGGPDAKSDAKAWIGKRVAVQPVVRCGKCERCLAGLGAHCSERTVFGATRGGGLAERVAVPLANLVALPDAIDDERAAFAVTIAGALDATKQVRIEGKTFITVLGEDLVALVTAQVMTRLNATVRIVARDATTLAVAEKLGIKHRLADEVGRRGDQHVVVDCIGSAESLELAMRLVRPRGTVLLKATTGRIDMTLLVDSELRLQGCGHGALSEAIELLARRGIEVAALVDRRVALNAAAAVFSEHRAGALVRM